jgi:hypothetical protein
MGPSVVIRYFPTRTLLYHPYRPGLQLGRVVGLRRVRGVLLLLLLQGARYKSYGSMLLETTRFLVTRLDAFPSVVCGQENVSSETAIQ